MAGTASWRSGAHCVGDIARADHRAGEQDQGTITLVVGLAKAFERVSLPVVWAWATHFKFPWKVSRVLRGTPSSKGSRPSRPSSFGRNGAACSFAFVLQDALTEVMKVHPPLKLKVFDDIHSFCRRTNEELSGSAEKVLKSIRSEIDEKGLRLSITE